ncbi:MAG: hypothetical protein U5M51_07145 [Emticicia sp.]|nr:hypothetical protein [Emticicia sp.]
MTTLVLEVNTEQKKALKGILRYLKVNFQEQSTKKINARDFAQKIDYGIDPNKEIDAKPFSNIENSADYVQKLRIPFV